MQAVPTVFHLLDHLALDIARNMIPLIDIATTAHYASFMNTLAWFMDGNDNRHMVEYYRAENCRGLQLAFKHHAMEESGHHILAAHDLGQLGYSMTAMPPQAVTTLHNLVDSWDAARKLGYSATVESMAAHLAKPLLAMKHRLDVPDAAWTCLACHIDVDSSPYGHAVQQRTVAQQYLTSEQWLPFTLGAIAGSKLWADMMCAALQSPMYATTDSTIDQQLLA